MRGRTSFVYILLFTLHASSVFAFGGRPAQMLSDDSGRFQIAANIPSAQQQLIQEDLRYLSAKSFSAQDIDLNKIMHQSIASGALMQNWLSDRVQYIVGENLDVEKNLSAIQSNYPYQNPGILPVEEHANSGGQTGSILDWVFPHKSGLVLVMQNLGSALYSFGKSKNVLVGLQIPGGDIVAIHSPRTGIIQVGEGLFQNHDPDNKKLNSIGNRLFRLATFFHEAHHSDGNGESLGFVHALCPDGHIYANNYACDRNLNGPYTVGATVMKLFAMNCAECSAKELEEIKLDMLDSYSRVIVSTVKDPNMQFEESAQMQSSECEYVMAHPEMKVSKDFIIELCGVTGDDTLMQQKNATIASTAWDEAPEGSR